MSKSEITAARRALLKAEIDKQGLSVVAKNANKPASQIKDMVAGRKTFGDRIAIELGPLIRPDMPRDWLVYPEMAPNDPYPGNHAVTHLVSKESTRQQEKSDIENSHEIPDAVLALARRIGKIPPDLYPMIEGALLGVEAIVDQRRIAANGD